MAMSVQLHPLLPTHTFQSLEGCSTMPELKQHHARIIKLGLSYDNDAIGRVIKFSAISDSGDFNYALKAFHTLPFPDPFIYNTIIRGRLQHPNPSNNSMQLYIDMLEERVTPNKFTFPPLVRACCLDNAVEMGKQVHAHVIKHGFYSDGFSQNNLIYMYVEFNCLEEARRVFDHLPVRDDVSWTTLISGYAQSGRVDEAFDIFESMPDETRRNSPVSWNAIIAGYVHCNRFHEAFDLFHRMRTENVVLDKYLVASLLSTCTGLGALKQGESIYEYIKKSGIEIDSKLATTVIDMYCKCGCIDKAFLVFNGLQNKGVSSWNCMIGGLATHGRGKEAIKLLKEMERENVVNPDYITFVNVLSACAHSGLVEEGKHYFHRMRDVYGIEPGMEHYGCLVDLLGRAGLLEEAKNVIDAMPMSPDSGVLGALFGACRIHANIELGVEIGMRVIELDPENSGRYVLLANLYADAGRWEDVANVRKLMNDRGVKKAPGFSVIETEGVVSEFIAGGRTHPQAREIYAKVHEMLARIRSAGYVPDSVAVSTIGSSSIEKPEDSHAPTILHDIREEETENPLYYHSEKLAIAFGLLKTRPGEIIRITKNLRVCRDCHLVTKLISKVYDREIVVRDRNRFHHFKGGECSCNDYW